MESRAHLQCLVVTWLAEQPVKNYEVKTDNTSLHLGFPDSALVGPAFFFLRPLLSEVCTYVFEIVLFTDLSVFPQHLLEDWFWDPCGYQNLGAPL